MKKNYFILISILISVLIILIILNQIVSNRKTPSPIAPTLFPSITSIVPSIKKDTAPENAVEEQEKFDKANHPDLYLSNKTPYQTSDFSINSFFKKEPSGHFAFVVNQLGVDKEKSKVSLLEWLKSLGLTEIQIQSFDITYK